MTMTMQATQTRETTFADLLASGIQLEAQTQHVYQEFANLFAHCPDVAAFWRALAAEEASHKNRLIQIRDGMSRERLARPGDVKMLQAAQRLLAVDLGERLAEVRDLDDAYELANDLESSETNTIFQFFLTELSQDMHVVSALMRDLDEHVERLMAEFPVAYATRTERLAVKALRS